VTAKDNAQRNSRIGQSSRKGTPTWRALFFMFPFILGQLMTWRAMQLICLAALLVTAKPVMAHCQTAGNAYIRGDYQGDCDEETELAQGRGEAKGADSYVGNFVKGRPEGKGVYTWENGARLDGSFKVGKAHGPGVYISAKGVRYEGQFANGKLEGLKTADCPSKPGPLTC
jgi:MORN repeat